MSTGMNLVERLAHKTLSSNALRATRSTSIYTHSHADLV